MDTKVLTKKEIKDVLKEAMKEVFKEETGMIREVVLETIEDIGMMNAIKEAEKENEFVDEKDFLEKLDKAIEEE